MPDRRPRLLVDECVHGAVARALESWGYDVVRVPRAGTPDSLPDAFVVEYAAQMDRIVLTDDVSTMPAELAAYIEREGDHPGMIVAPKCRPLGQYLNDLRFTLETLDPENLRNTFVWLRTAEAPARGS